MGRVLSITMATFLVLAAFAQAQERKPDERDIRDGYIVEVIGAGGKVAETIGAALTPEEADKLESDWNAQRPGNVAMIRIRQGKVEVPRPAPSQPSGVAGGIKGSNIVVPVPKIVDPGATKRAEPKVPSLAGSSGTGTIGESKVAIQFTGEGEQGEFVVSSELEGKGKWRQLGPFVQMDTDLEKYAGKIDGDKITGTRRLIKSGRKDQWAITLVKAINSKVKLSQQRRKMALAELRGQLNMFTRTKKPMCEWSSRTTDNLFTQCVGLPITHGNTKVPGHHLANPSPQLK
jgi:hypothetical protein